MSDKEAMRDAIEHNIHWFYDWLRGFSKRLIRQERRGHTLQATALANEVMIRLCQWEGALTGDRGEQQADSLRLIAASIARQVLVDHARKRLRLKRGGAHERIPLEQADLLQAAAGEEILRIDEVLSEFEELYPEEARLVQLRFFGGATLAEAARLLEWSERTASRRWAFAKAWLHEAYQAPSRDAPSQDFGTRSDETTLGTSV